MNGKVTALIVSLLLWGVFFIKIPVLLFGGVILAFVSFMIAVREGATVDRIFVVLLLNLGYWLVSGLVTGGIKPAMLANPQYLMAEGRGFLYYIPLFTLSVAVVGNAQLSQVIRVVYAMGIAVLLLFVVWLLVRPGFISGGRAGNFYGFVTSHTGAGTLFGIIGAFLAVYGHQVGRRPIIYLGLAMVLPVFGSASRQAIVGLLAVLGWYVIRLGRARLIAYAGVLMAVSIALMPVLTPHTWERTAGLFNKESVEAVFTTLEKSNWEPGLTPEVEGRHFNVLARFLYWEYAVRQIAKSPYIGSGFGRFNDTEAQFVGEPGVLRIATSGPASPIQLQAHNSYLHLWAELGVLGLGLMLWLWWAMYRELRVTERCLVAAPDIAAYFVACQGLIIFVLACSMFGHAFASPITGVPVLAIIAVGLAYRRRLQCSPA